MKRGLRLFRITLLWHFGLTVATGLVWNALITAVTSHRIPALLHATYASFYLFVPFCQPVFWPLSDWVAHSGHFNMLPGLRWQYIELLVIAFLNSLVASAVLLGLAWAVQTTRTRRCKLPAA